jgi:isoleucyl-tRNA synthetase
VGALFKEKTREVLRDLRELEGEEALRAVGLGRPVKAGNVEVPLSVFELVTTPEEGFEVAEKGGVFVAVRKERDTGLVAEGLVRDVARRLQALRKERGFVPTAMLDSASVAGLEDEDLALLEPLSKEIAFLVRVREVKLSKEKAGGPGWAVSDLDGRPLYLRVG